MTEGTAGPRPDGADQVPAEAMITRSGPIAVLVGVPGGAALYVLAVRLLRILGPVDHDRLASLARSFPAAVRPLYRRVLDLIIVGASRA